VRLLWGLAGAAALLWPDHISSALDGAPLDGVVEALLVGGIVPALCWFYPRFLSTTRARACIAALVAWRIASALLFVQDGWCVQFVPSRPFAKDAGRAPHAWDFRADWRSFDPACSAIMTRSYRSYAEFPAWFFNLPPPNESWPAPADIPPGATTAMHVRGYLTTPSPGMLDFEGAPGVAGGVSVDGRNIQWPVRIEPGTHQVSIDVVLTYTAWAVVSKWNGRDLWSSGVAATLRRPSALDLAVRPWIRWVPTLLAMALIAMWIASAAALVGDPSALAWAGAASGAVALIVTYAPTDLARWAIPALAAAVFVPVVPRLRNQLGAYVLVGVPWLAFVLAKGVPSVGTFHLYEFGNDFWMYQRFGYRIVMQGYWLEGGTRLFYFQPLYRWVSGVLHAAFGDSSVGERFWDGFCLLAGSMVTFRIVRAFAGFRWAIAGAVMPLAVFAVGTGRYLLGFGLSEITSAGFIYMAVLFAIRSRGRRTASAIVAGVLATLGFYTRLNNGIMAIGIACFALPLTLPWSHVLDPRGWWPRLSWRAIAGLWGGIGAGLLLFAWRNWHYSGVFSVFYGTQRYIVAIWQPHDPLGANLDRLLTNLGRVLTFNDPPRFDPVALPVMGGALAAVAALVSVPRLRELPAAAVLFFVAAIAGSFVAYGFAYPGRFSIHMLPITCALTTCAAAALLRASPSTQPVVPRRGGVVDEAVEQHQRDVVGDPPHSIE
jgi:hypothetical protein